MKKNRFISMTMAIIFMAALINPFNSFSKNNSVCDNHGVDNFGFYLSLFVAADSVIRGPYLQTGTDTSIIIKWRTNVNTNSKVWYGNSPTNLTETLVVSGSRDDHEVTITGLTANTTYYYAVGDDGGQLAGADSDHYFITAPTVGTSQPITAWILGDCGEPGEDQDSVRDAYYDYIDTDHTDMILLLGDNAYDDGTDLEYEAAIFDVYDSKLINSVLWSCPGNHEYGMDCAAPYYDIFSFPQNGEAGGLASNTEKYYSFDYGNIHIISLDSHGELRSPGGPMLTWLENDLAATSQEWVIVIFHHPPYTKGSHDSDDPEDSGGRMEDMREYVVPICEAYGVDLILTGHSHSYERSKLIHGHYGHSSTYDSLTHNIDGGDGSLAGDGAYRQNFSEEGTVYIVTGSASKLGSAPTEHPVMYYYASSLGSTVLEVDGGTMDVKFLNTDGTIEDSLTLLQNRTPSVSWTNLYDGQILGRATITLEADASDSDGTVDSIEFFVDGSSVGTDTSAPFSVNWTPSTNGNYTLKATATDNGGATESTEEISITIQTSSTIDISSQINVSSDDVEERLGNGNGEMKLDNSDLELGKDGSAPQKIGLRFNSLNIPANATVTNAYIQFTADETNTETTDLTIHGEDHDNAVAFSTTDYDVSNRDTTVASVDWAPASWTTVGAAGTDQQTPDLKTIVQEIINRSDWAPDNSMVFMITGTGERTAESYDGSSGDAPDLHISYTYGPTVSWTNPDDGEIFTNLNAISFEVDATDIDGTVDSVEFFVDGTSIGTDTNAPYSKNWTPTAYGNYTLKAVATDDNGVTGEQEISISIQQIFSVQINDGNDDAEERDNGTMSLTSSDLEMVQDGSSVNTVGLRFDSLNIPSNAIVTNAYIQFTSDEIDSVATSLTIKGEAHDDAAAFTSSDNDITSRTTTSSSVNWVPAPWTATGAAGSDQQTPNLKTVVQEIIDRQGWSTNNSVAFIISGSGPDRRTAESYNGSQNDAPVLNITYTTVNVCDPFADADNDGYCSNVDCDDSDATIYIGASCDDGDNTTANDAYDNNCNCTGTPLTSVIFKVNDGDDDAEENKNNDGDMSLTSSDLEMVTDGSKDQVIGIRFDKISIPTTAKVTNAYIQFTVKDTTSESTSLTIKGEAHANALIFEDIDSNITKRTVTVDSVNWSPAPWTTEKAAGADQQTPDLSAIVQEIIDDTGWATDSAMVFIINGTGKRSAFSYDGNCAYFAPTFHVTYYIDTASEVSISIPISDNDDDVEERTSNGEMKLNNSDLELGYDGAAAQKVGLRFNNIDLPPTATVTNAYIQFTVDESNTETTSLTIHGEDIANASAFVSTAYDVSDRDTTDTSVDWTPANWTTVGDAGDDQQTPDISTIVQEIIDSNSWSANNSMVFIISGSGERTAVSHDQNSTKAATLHITYESGGSSLVKRPNPDISQVAKGTNKKIIEADTSSSTVKENSLHLFPNPVKSQLNIHYQSADGQIAFMELFDPTGRRVRVKTLQTKKGLNKVQMNLSEMPTGMYFFRVMESGKYLTEKVIISN